MLGFIEMVNVYTSREREHYSMTELSLEQKQRTSLVLQITDRLCEGSQAGLVGFDCLSLQ